MDNEVLKAAIEAPKLFIDASLGKGEEYTRDPGFQLTKEQIVNLRKYEVLGLSLPTEINDIIVYLNYGKGDSGSPGLGAKDFQKTFKTTYDHAAKWSDLRLAIMMTGNQLQIFAGSILGLSGAITKLYTDQKVSGDLDRLGIDTPQKYLDQKVQNPDLPGLEVPQQDLESLGYYLDQVLSKVKDAHDKASAVRKRIDDFGKAMGLTVLPEIKLRLKAVSENTYKQDIQDLQGVIDKRSNDIEALSKQYDEMVGESLKSAASLNVAGLALAIYTGVKAENIRKERNKLKAEQERDNLAMTSKNQTLASLNRIRGDLQELRDVTIEADVATQNLMVVWGSLSNFISASKDEVDSLPNALTLRIFNDQLMSIAAPWQKIYEGSDQLLRVFAAADKEYLESQLLNAGGQEMFKAFAASDSPVFNVDKLRGFNSGVQEANVSAQMHFERWNYEQARVDKVNLLAVAVGEATIDVRLISNKAVGDLQLAKDKLVSLQQQLQSSGAEADAVQGSIRTRLTNLSEKLMGRSDELKGANGKLNKPYSRDDTAQLAKILLDEMEYSEQRTKDLKQQEDELRAKIKSVSDGMDIVAKAGIEKIGEQVELTKDKVVELGVAPPQVTVVMLAVETLKNLLADVGVIVTYLNMVAELDRLRQRLEKLEKQASEYELDVKRSTGQITLLKELDKVDEQRSDFVKEYSNLLAYFDNLASKFVNNEAKPVADRVEYALAEIGEDITFLKSIVRQA